MENIVNVDIDAAGRFKYILIKIKIGDKEKYVVRGYSWAEFHGIHLILTLMYLIENFHFSGYFR